MKITLKKAHKSLLPFTSDELTPFSIVTGKNGSGKSQLLELLGKSQTEYSDYLIVSPDIKRIQVEGLTKSESGVYGDRIWTSLLEEFINTFNALSDQGKQLLDWIVQNTQNEIEYNLPPTKYISDEKKYFLLLRKAAKTRHGILYGPIEPENINPAAEHSALIDLLGWRFTELINVAKYVTNYRQKSTLKLTSSDFYNTPVPHELISSRDLFKSNIEEAFYTYAKKRHINAFDYFAKKEYSATNDSISRTEFNKKTPPPWTIMNDILRTNNLPYYFNGLDERDFSVQANYTFPLFKEDNIEVKFEDLSSGEKVIFGLITKLFTGGYYGKKLLLPDLLILDEPDCHLHPEMSQLLLNVLQKTFVEQYGINVIITTHSPSTVALAHENNIYELKNGKDSSLKKVSKDHSLEILTGFIPTLSIDYKNHRQVFVESPTDVDYYQKIYNKYSQAKKLSHKLYFLSNSHGKGNCAQVYNIVNQMRDAGNSTSFGIVDWDLKNKQSQYVFVHGLNERYSVENFVYDPIYISCLFITLDAHDFAKEIDMNETDNQFLIGEKTETELQKLVKYFFSKYEKKFPAQKYKDDKVQIKYANGKKIEIPEWYLLKKGHDIEKQLIEVFPALSRYKKEGELQKELATVIAKCYPFVPQTTIDLLESIANTR